MIKCATCGREVNVNKPHDERDHRIWDLEFEVEILQSRSDYFKMLMEEKATELAESEALK